MTDWRNISPDNNEPSPSNLLGECIACIGINICCVFIRKPKIIILILAIVAFIFGGICINSYRQKPAAKWATASYLTNDTYSNSYDKTAGYINGSIWIYGGYDLWTAHIDTLDYNEPDEFHVYFDPSIVLHQMTWNDANTVVDKATNSILSVADMFNDTDAQYYLHLVSFNPNLGSQGAKYYPVPKNKQQVLFDTYCIAIDNNTKEIYILGGYLSDNLSISSESFGEILTFDLTTETWTNYYDTSIVGELVIDGKNITYYACSYYDDKLFVFGGSNYDSYPESIYSFNSIYTLDLNNINSQWQILPSALQLNVSEANAYLIGEDIHIVGGCAPDIKYNDDLDCFISRQVFNVPTLSVTTLDLDRNKGLIRDKVMVVHDYYTNEIYVVDTSYNYRFDLYYFKQAGNQNITYLWRAMGGIGIGIILLGLFGYTIKNGAGAAPESDEYTSINRK